MCGGQVARINGRLGWLQTEQWTAAAAEAVCVTLQLTRVVCTVQYVSRAGVFNKLPLATATQPTSPLTTYCFLVPHSPHFMHAYNVIVTDIQTNFCV